ncbi:hypothetical protein [Phenylobacterium montanum]|uniref:Uncharacterized protein n=1 Tax=Phenylobacterium montanum TaxID=2823693 RepID=A0A975G2N6_9CAUL|nr:hypothetical protein [Caulobacter sp. S6]QUD89586.1 hypothetical protein KCG34_06810 [Caulobacter sp. S6]
MMLDSIALRIVERTLPLFVGSKDDFGLTCQRFAIDRTTCLLKWAIVNLVAILAPTGSLTGQDVNSLGQSALISAAVLRDGRVRSSPSPLGLVMSAMWKQARL